MRPETIPVHPIDRPAFSTDAEPNDRAAPLTRAGVAGVLHAALRAHRQNAEPGRWQCLMGALGREARVSVRGEVLKAALRLTGRTPEAPIRPCASYSITARQCATLLKDLSAPAA